MTEQATQTINRQLYQGKKASLLEFYTSKTSDVNEDWTCKDKDKDKDFTYSYLLQVAAKPTIAIKQQR